MRRMLGRSALLAASVALALGGAWLVVRAIVPSGDESTEPFLRSAVPFALLDQSGKQRTLEEHRGRFVLLHFWASWCAPCVEELPSLVELARRLDDRPISIVAVSLDESWADARKVLPRELPGQFVALIDPAKKVPELYGSFQYPETYLVTPKSRVAMKWVGKQDWLGAAVFDGLRARFGI